MFCNLVTTHRYCVDLEFFSISIIFSITFCQQISSVFECLTKNKKLILTILVIWNKEFRYNQGGFLSITQIIDHVLCEFQLSIINCLFINIFIILGGQVLKRLLEINNFIIKISTNLSSSITLFP